MNSIVFITVDCLRSDHLGCYGYDRPTSPNIDEFAETATVFENAYSNCPGTRWAFQSLHTGVSTLQIDGLGIPEGYVPLAEHLSNAGYATGGFANNGFVSRDYGYGTGFDTYYSTRETADEDETLQTIGKQIDQTLGSDFIRERILVPAKRWITTDDNNRFQPTHSDEDTVSEALAFLKSADRPFFLWVHLMDAHTPYGYWPDHLEALRGDADIEHTISPRDEGKVTAGEPPEQEVIDTYDACIRSIDEQVGRLLDAVSDNATVVFTGDHGEEFGRFGKFHEASLHSSLTQVPIIVRDPEVDAERKENPAQHLDIPPTLLHAAGLDVPDSWEGEPLQANERELDEPIFYTLGEDEIAVRVGEWKYIESDGAGELYQVPHSGTEAEQTEDSKKREELQDLVESYRANAGSAGVGQSELNEDSGLSEEVEDNLEDLGYL